MKDEGGAGFAGSSPPFLGRERAVVDVDVSPERHSPRYHETCLAVESVSESEREREEKETEMCVVAHPHRQKSRMFMSRRHLCYLVT